jgi:hypothetical protein
MDKQCAQKRRSEKVEVKATEPRKAADQGWIVEFSQVWLGGHVKLTFTLGSDL